MWLGEPPPTHTMRCLSSARSMRTVSTLGSANGRDAAQRVARRLLDLVGARDPRSLGSRSGSDLAGIDAAVARDEGHDRLLVTHENERLHDLVEPAPRRLGSVGRSLRPGRELLDAGVGAGVAKEGGDPRDGLRPGRYHAGNLAACSTRAL